MPVEGGHLHNRAAVAVLELYPSACHAGTLLCTLCPTMALRPWDVWEAFPKSPPPSHIQPVARVAVGHEACEEHHTPGHGGIMPLQYWHMGHATTGSHSMMDAWGMELQFLWDHNSPGMIGAQASDQNALGVIGAQQWGHGAQDMELQCPWH